MRLAPGLRLLLLCLALLGLLIGRGVPLPFAIDHGAVATESMSAAVHDCCDRPQPASTDNAALAGHCDSATCPMGAPVLHAGKPPLAAAPARPAFVMVTPDNLEGRRPSPLLEPPRA